MTSLGPQIRIFGDGSSLGNPGSGGWGLIVEGESSIVEKGGQASNVTNNQMELRAFLEGLNVLIDAGVTASHIGFYWDSQFVLSGVKAWRFSWRRKSWKTSEGQPVKNLELWKEVDQKMESLKTNRFQFFYVEGHRGIPANERVDTIARSFAEGQSVDLYEGPANSYSIDLGRSLPDEVFELQRVSHTKSKKKALYYLSYVGGAVHRDKTWSECEARVKGVAGARFKKIFSKDEDRATLQAWGVSPS